jgi:hypothetical protein
VVAALVMPATAQAAWTAPKYISPFERDASDVATAIDADHDSITAWTLDDTLTTRVQARYRTAAGGLGPIINVSAVGSPATDPQVAMLPDGNALVVWRGWDGDYYRIWARVLTPTTAGSPQVVSPAGRDAFFPQVAVDSTGTTLIGWERAGRIQLRERAPSGHLTGIQTLAEPASRSRFTTSPWLAENAAGDAAVTWAGANNAILGLNRAADGTLGTIHTLATSGSSPTVAIDPSGDSIASWSTNSAVLARAWSSAGVLAPTDTIGSLTSSSGFPRVELEPTGAAYVVWAKTFSTVAGRARGADGSLGTEDAVATDARSPNLDVDAAGNMQIVWTGVGNGSARFVDAREHLAGGGLTPVQTVFPRSTVEPPALSVAPDGVAVAGATRSLRSDGSDHVQISLGP